ESNRYSLPVILRSHATYAWASSQFTLMTGRLLRPQPWSFTPPSGGQPPTRTQASQSSNVTSYRDTANGLAIVTGCCGPSFGKRPFSLTGDPIRNSPAGMTTIMGQSLAHS